MTRGARRMSSRAQLRRSLSDSPYLSSFVVATSSQTSHYTIFGSYEEANIDSYDKVKIWEACRATTAATTFFDPITIGPYNESFIDGGFCYNNPVQIVKRQAQKLWGKREALIISIGTGNSPITSIGGNCKKIAESLAKIVTQTERTNDDFEEENPKMVESDSFFRFNVTHGLEDVDLEEYQRFKSHRISNQRIPDEPWESEKA